VQEEQGGEILRLRFHGNGFMYRMVRMLVGTAFQVAAGKMTPAELRGVLQKPEGLKTRHCAPPEGLYLKEVIYE
jgi:tRNA pseudouridine38-40 synthase